MSTMTCCKNWRRERSGNEVRPRAAERDSGNENRVANLFVVDLFDSR